MLVNTWVGGRGEEFHGNAPYVTPQQVGHEEHKEPHLRDVLLLQQADAWCLGLVWQLVQLERPGHGHTRLQKGTHHYWAVHLLRHRPCIRAVCTEG